MAISANKSASLASGWTIKAEFTETGTSVASNTSSISCKATISSDSAHSFSYSSGAGTLKIYWHDNHTNTDTLVASKTVYTVNTSSSSSTSGTISATHNNDGTLSGYAKATWTKTYSSQWVPASGNVSTDTKALTTIARKSNPTLSTSSVSLPASSGSLTVTTNRASSSFTHTITLKVGNTTITTSSNVGASVSYNWTSIQNAILATIPSGKSTTLTVICETFSSGTSLGTNTVTCAVSVNSGAGPSFSTFTYADTNATTTAITGNDQILISGKSTLTAIITAANKATANYSASMSSYTFAINGQTQSQAYSSSDIIKNLGAVTISGTANQAKDLVVAAIDSRGYSKSVTKNITVVAYNNPIINATATRANGFENNTTIAVSGSVSPLLVNGTGKNAVNTTSGLRYRYKSQNTTTWGAWTNLACTYNSTTGAVSSSSFVLNLDNQTAYDFQFELTDKLATTTSNLVVAVGQPSFYSGADGRVSVGGMPTESKQTGQDGQLEIKGHLVCKSGATNTNVGMSAKRTDVNRSLLFGVGTGGTNAGIYDDNAGSWLIYDDKTKTYLPRFQAATGNIGDLAVTNAKIANTTITGGKIANSTIGVGKIDWSTITAITGASTIFSATNYTVSSFKAYKIGRILIIERLQFASHSSSSSGRQVATLKAEYRPTNTLRIPVQHGANDAVRMGLVQSDGKLMEYAPNNITQDSLWYSGVWICPS